MSLTNPFDMAGMGTAQVSTEREFLWNTGGLPIRTAGVLVSTTIDAGNTPTTQLRRGLLLGIVTASGKLGVYDPAATDGRNVAQGVLDEAVNMLDLQTGSAADKWAMVVIGGPVKASQIIGLDAQARRQMHNRFLFDDALAGQPFQLACEAKTADYTCTVAENNKLFTNRGAAGAVIFTLPACFIGGRYRFFVEANQNVTITAPAGTLVAFNNAAATSIAFSTASEKIGASVEVVANENGSKWLAIVSLGAETQTPTIA